MQFDFSKLPFPLLKDIGVFSFFIFLNQVFDQLNNNVPSFILGVFSGAKQVAIFAIAVQIRNVFFMLSTSITSVFVPKVNEMVAERNNNDELNELMIKVGRIQLALLSFILGGFIVVGKFFVVNWAGSQYEIVYYLIIIMVFPVLVPLSQNIGIEIQRAKNMHVFRSLCYIIFSVVNCIITAILAGEYGVVGPTVGYIFFFVFAPGIIMNVYYHKKVGLNMIVFWKSVSNLLIPFLFASIFLIFLQHLIPLNNLIGFIAYGVTYVAVYVVLYLLISASPYEKMILRGLLKH